MFHGNTLMKQVVDRHKSDGGWRDVSYQLVFVSTVFNAVLGLSHLFSLVPNTGQMQSTAIDSSRGNKGLLRSDCNLNTQPTQNLQQLVAQEKSHLTTKSFDSLRRARSKSIPNIPINELINGNGKVHTRLPLLPAFDSYESRKVEDDYDAYMMWMGRNNRRPLLDEPMSRRYLLDEPIPRNMLDQPMRRHLYEEPIRRQLMDDPMRRPFYEEPLKKLSYEDPMRKRLQDEPIRSDQFTMRMQMLETQECMRALENMLTELRIENQSLESSVRQANHQRLMLMYEMESVVRKARIDAQEQQDSFTVFLHNIYFTLYTNGFQALQVPNDVPNQQPPPWFQHQYPLGWEVPKYRYNIPIGGGDGGRRGVDDYMQWLRGGSKFVPQPQQPRIIYGDMETDLSASGTDELGMNIMMPQQMGPPPLPQLYRKNGHSSTAQQSIVAKRQESKRNHHKRPSDLDGTGDGKGQGQPVPMPRQFSSTNPTSVL